jgi:hypothetical protein
MLLQRITISNIILFILFLFLTGCATEGKEAGAHIKFDHVRHDFGKIEQGEVIDHIFKFENTGSDTLKINKVYSS